MPRFFLKKTKSGFLYFFILFNMFLFRYLYASPYRVKILSKTVPIKEQPTLSSDIVITATKGTTFEVIQELPEWYVVCISSGTNGYISKKYAQVEQVQPPKTSSSPVTEREKRYVLITNADSFIRTSPNSASKTLAKTKINNAFLLLSLTGQWYQIALPAGQKGYVPQSAAKIISQKSYQELHAKKAAATIPPSPQKQKVVSPPKTIKDSVPEKHDSQKTDNDETWFKNKYTFLPQDNIRLRNLPDPHSATIRIAKKGDVFKILGKENNWYEIFYSPEQNAYVYAPLIKVISETEVTQLAKPTTPGVTEKPAPQDTVIRIEGSKRKNAGKVKYVVITSPEVYLKAKASLTAQTVMKATKGEEFKLIWKLARWYEIEITPGKTAFIPEPMAEIIVHEEVDYEYSGLPTGLESLPGLPPAEEPKSPQNDIIPEETYFLITAKTVVLTDAPSDTASPLAQVTAGNTLKIFSTHKNWYAVEITGGIAFVNKKSGKTITKEECKKMQERGPQKYAEQKPKEQQPLAQYVLMSAKKTNVRNKPNKKAHIIDTVLQNQIFKLSGLEKNKQQEKWYQISISSPIAHTGYILATLGKVLTEAELQEYRTAQQKALEEKTKTEAEERARKEAALKAKAEAEQKAREEKERLAAAQKAKEQEWLKDKYILVTVKRAILQNKPSIKGKIIATLDKGTSYKLQARSKDWYEVSFSSGTAFLHANLGKILTESELTTWQQQETELKAKKQREKAETEQKAREVAELKARQAAAAEAKEQEWLADKYVLINVPNVNIRKNQTKNAPIIAKALKGETFKLISRTKEWYEVFWTLEENVYVATQVATIISEAELQTKLDAEQKTKEEKLRLEAERIARTEAEKKARQEMAAAAKAEKERREKEKAQLKQQQEAETQAKMESFIADKYVLVTVNNANVRSAPSPRAAIVAKPKSDADYKLIWIEKDKTGTDWYKISVSTGTGEKISYISSTVTTLISAQELQSHRAQQKRIMEEKAAKAAEEQARKEVSLKAKQEALHKAYVETVQKVQDETMKKARLEAEQKAQAEAEKKAKEEAERKGREEKEQIAAEKRAAELAWAKDKHILITAKKANIRKTRSKTAPVLTTVAFAESFKLLERTTDWYHIQTSSATGYISSPLAKIITGQELQQYRTAQQKALEEKTKTEAEERARKEAALKAKAEAEQKAREEKERLAAAQKAKEQEWLKDKYILVTVKRAILQNKPSIKGKIIATLDKGTSYKLQARSKDWYEVSFSSGTAFLHANLGKILTESELTTWQQQETELKAKKQREKAETEQKAREVAELKARQAAEAEAKEQEWLADKYVLINVPNVNIRKNQTKNAPIIAKALKGETFKLISRTKEWYEVFWTLEENVYVATQVATIISEAELEIKLEQERKAKEEKLRQEQEKKAQAEAEKKARLEAAAAAQAERERKEKEEAQLKARLLEEAKIKEQEWLKDKYVLITAKTTPLRERPNASAKIIGQVKFNESYKLYSRIPQWYEIQLSSATAFITAPAGVVMTNDELSTLRQEQEKIRLEAEQRARQAAEAKAKREAEEKERQQALQTKLAEERKAKEEAELKAKEVAELKAKQEAELLVKEHEWLKDKYALITTPNCKLREKPRAGAKVILQTKENETFKLVSRAKKDWYEITVSGNSAFIETKMARIVDEQELNDMRLAQAKDKEEATLKAKLAAEEKARIAAEEKVKKEAAAVAKLQQEQKARQEQEQKARQIAEKKAQLEQEEKAKREAALKAKLAAERKAREEAELKAKELAELKAKQEAEARAAMETLVSDKYVLITNNGTNIRAAASPSATIIQKAKSATDYKLLWIEKDKKGTEWYKISVSTGVAGYLSAAVVKLINDQELQAYREQQQKQAEEKARQEAELKAKIEAAEKAKKEAEERMREEQEHKARLEEERRIRIQEYVKDKHLLIQGDPVNIRQKPSVSAPVAGRAKKEDSFKLEWIENEEWYKIQFSTGPATSFGYVAATLAKVITESELAAIREVEQKAKEEAELKAKEDTIRQARLLAEEKARKEAELLAKLEQEQHDHEEKLRQDEEARKKQAAELQARLEAERKAQAEAEQKAREAAEEQTRRIEEAIKKEQEWLKDKYILVTAPYSAVLKAPNKKAPLITKALKDESFKLISRAIQNWYEINYSTNTAFIGSTTATVMNETELAGYRQMQEQARQAAEQKLKETTELKVKELAEKLAQKEEETKSRIATELKAKEEAERKAKELADLRAKLEAEEKARRDSKKKLKEETEQKARKEAELQALEETAKKARLLAEEKAKKEAELLAKLEAEKKAAEEETRKETEEKARMETERKEREKAERIAREEADRRAKEEKELKAKHTAEEKAKKETDEKARLETEQKARAEKARRDAEERIRIESFVKDKYVYVVSDFVNVRQQPSKTAMIQGKINKGEYYKLNWVATDWYEIKIPSGTASATGFVYGPLVKLVNETDYAAVKQRAEQTRLQAELKAKEEAERKIEEENAKKQQEKEIVTAQTKLANTNFEPSGKGESKESGIEDNKEYPYISVKTAYAEIRSIPDINIPPLFIALKDDVFKYNGQQKGWYHIVTFSGETRYIRKSQSRGLTTAPQMPKSAVLRREIYDTVIDAKDRAMLEATLRYPTVKTQQELQEKIFYQQNMEEKFILDVFHKYKIAPAIYVVILQEAIDNNW